MTLRLRRIFLFASLLLAGGLAAFAQRGGTADERVELVHADRNMYDRAVDPDARRLAGKVHFKQGAMQLFSDSAVFYQSTNSFKAFGHVRLLQGDTLSLTGERLFYDGQSQIGRMTGRDVTLKHRARTLITDSLVYYRAEGCGRYFDGGKLIDGGSTLTSDNGEYFTGSRESYFSNNVHLRGERFNLTTNDLHYNLHTHWAHLLGPSNIISRDNNIYTEDAYYNTDTREARMTRNSKLIKPQGRELTGDSLHYDKRTGLAHVYGHVTYTDRPQQRTLVSDNAVYNENTGLLNADGNVRYTDRLNQRTLTCDRGEYYEREKLVKGYGHVVFTEIPTQRTLTCERGDYNEVTGEAHAYDNMHFQDHLAQQDLTAHRGEYNDKTGWLRAVGEVDMQDFKRRARLRGDSVAYNQLTGEGMATGHALVEDFSQPQVLSAHADTLRIHTYNLDTDTAYRVVRGIRHVRAYRDDVQAVCDTLVFDQRASTIRLLRDPIVWSDQRQVLGEEIVVYVNDSTVDSIYVNRQALVAEQVDSTHFNQLSAHQLRAYFDEGEIVRNEAQGNVRAVMFPLEKDSLLLYHNYTETTAMRMDIRERKLRRIWTPAAESYFYAVGLAPRSQTYLDNFAWFDYIRPLSADDLMEWRPKKSGTELRTTVRRAAPLQTLPPSD
ncbi:MAG: hypothetical protein J6M53_01860 [Bacteroidaceae bacterium]|nr:hypothetical protein [Bacteroidaceae bacterium]